MQSPKTLSPKVSPRNSFDSSQSDSVRSAMSSTLQPDLSVSVQKAIKIKNDTQALLKMCGLKGKSLMKNVEEKIQALKVNHSSVLEKEKLAYASIKNKIETYYKTTYDVSKGQIETEQNNDLEATSNQVKKLIDEKKRKIQSGELEFAIRKNVIKKFMFREYHETEENIIKKFEKDIEAETEKLFEEEKKNIKYLGNYQNEYDVEGGYLVANSNGNNLENSIKNNQFFLHQIQHAKEVTGKNSPLSRVSRKSIINDETKKVIQGICKDKKSNTLYFKPTDKEFYQLIGTPNGQGLAFLVIDSGAMLGIKGITSIKCSTKDGCSLEITYVN